MCKISAFNFIQIQVFDDSGDRTSPEMIEHRHLEILYAVHIVCEYRDRNHVEWDTDIGSGFSKGQEYY